VSCQSVLRLAGPAGTNAPAFMSSAVSAGGFGPSELRAAYGLTRASATRGRHETIAVVDAYRDPSAARDLASYRRHFHLGACTTSSGCLRIVNQKGNPRPLPRANADWAVEQSLDLDMVSAICPHCRILLVQAKWATRRSLGIAEDTAVAMGARFVSNSWSGTEQRGQWIYNHYFNHPGVAIVVASGDSGYGTTYPADLQYVTSVGGTALTRRASGSRPWTETAWGGTQAGEQGTGSGCSRRTAKPSWQLQPVDVTGCADRTENDVAAVADPATGVAVYDSYQTQGTWAMLGGTSAATPVITAIYALAGRPARRSYPASYPYQHPGHFHDVTAGDDGTCPAASGYLCHAERGYDGPTGLGTPRGIWGFARSGTDPVTVVDPGAQHARAGGTVRVKITGLDTRAARATLAYAATGLPPGLAVRPVARSSNAVVTGTIAASVAAGTTFHVVVTATDPGTRHSAATRFTIVVR
jgi:hypothetical protein